MVYYNTEIQGISRPVLHTLKLYVLYFNTLFISRLDLPPYESYQQLRDKLIKAIEGSEGFAGVD